MNNSPRFDEYEQYRADFQTLKAIGWMDGAALSYYKWYHATVRTERA